MYTDMDTKLANAFLPAPARRGGQYNNFSSSPWQLTVTSALSPDARPWDDLAKQKKQKT